MHFSLAVLVLAAESLVAAAANGQAVGGMLEGRIVLAGTAVQASTMVANTTDPEECGETHSLQDLVVDTSTRGLANVILAIRGASPPVSPPAPGRLVIDNRDCRFEPHAAVLTVGSTIEALNSDRVLHTTHLYGSREVNIALPFEGSRVSQRINEPGMIVVRCDVHGWMQAYVRVDSHPYHAVSAGDGSFQITGLPAGSFVLEAWHERLGRRQVPVVIDSGQTTRVEIDYPEPETRVQ
jgi:plastocyanin